jgi:gamma-glutamyltranspeptidase/glutathione hydrolase
MMRKFLSFCLLKVLFLGLLVIPQQTPAAFREPVRARNAMVASQHELASRIGVEVMRRGGNAVDAAVAVAFALAVVYPEAGNLGGGGFMLIRKRDGSTFAIDYREMAPGAANRDIFVDEKGELIRGEGGSRVGYRASGVPGTPAGLEMAFKKYGSGKVKWRELIEPSRKLAADGFVLSYRLANLFKSYKGDLEKYEDSKRIFLNGGKYFEEGDVLRQPDLAQTLGRMQKGGAAEFYTGRTAELIADDMKRNKGLITLEDLRNYVAKERTPLRGTYRGHEIVSMPPPSSGGIVMFQVLNMLEMFDLRKMGYNSAQRYHLVAEAMRRAFADRAEYMGDPDFANVPTEKLIDKSYARGRAGTINLTQASKSTEIKAGAVNFVEGMDTTHFTVADSEGTVVANTYTINDLYGSAVTIRGTGVLMNNEMDDFAARPGKPNLFGLIQGENNSVQPRKRPLSSMTPTIVLRKDGSVWFAIGARGGPRIITAVIQSVINVIDHDMNIQAAIDAPRVHQQWYPDEVLYEPFGLSPDTVNILGALGHTLAPRPSNIASATAIMIDEKGVKLGAIDSRSDGEALGY